MNQKNPFISYIFTALAVLLIFTLGYRLGQTGKLGNFGGPDTAINKKLYEGDFYQFWDVWEKLNAKFVDKEKLKSDDLYNGAIKGMVASAGDPYTFFLTAKENQESKDDLGGKFEGIGAQLGQKNGTIVVVAPLKNSPAEKVGLKGGDIIYKVNDEKITDWTLPKVVSKIRGPKGSVVNLTIYRGRKEMAFAITRDQIKIDSVELEFISDVAVLHLIKFGDETGREWDKAIAQISEKYQAKLVKGMVLDLRDNPGGYLQGAVYVASEFLPKGALVVKQVYGDGKEEKYEVSRKGKLLDIPLVVLLNGGSASASEIVSGALKDHHRANIYGEKSFGKGSVQEALDLYQGAGLHVTIAKWLLPAGSWIHEKGINPDTEIKQPDLSDEELNDTTVKPYDTQLHATLEKAFQIKMSTPSAKRDVSTSMQEN